MSASKVLYAAADIIDRYGWWDGGPGRGTRECALSAIGSQCAYLGVANDVAELLCRHIERDSMGPIGVASWNDSSDQATVTSTMRAVAAIERAREARLLPVLVPA